ncbi:MAG: hypothetical protein H6959_00880 [Chromatiaceae bacterium]|nr:hypothetical protein [Gammaproteobacteria bacterium]MCP5301081.1 hypothetical protein [Chromatiaceae bacterium]MCP5421447.1 hypothetical protein [Chromatiaceae bacterium]
METINLRRHYSRNTLLRMILLAVAAAALAVWKYDLINAVYFKDQLTATGWVINGAILALFLLGMLRTVGILISYMGEESALARFVRNVDKRPDLDPLKGVGVNSMIARRYATMRRLHEARSPINQNALAATLVASESTRNGLPRFINNILILSGVFGTIVSLSLALIGASDVLENAVSATGMGMVIHGMSTALSTTITAIVCYVFFGYMFQRLTDAQTNLISGVEQVTTAFLMPKFQVQTDNVLYEFTGLIRSLQGLVDQLQQSQIGFEATQDQLADTIALYRSKVEGLDDHLDTIKHQLHVGFRLRDDE